MRFLVLALIAVAFLGGCDRKGAARESTVTLNDRSYRVIGAERVEARANKSVKVVKDDKGVEKKVEEMSQTLMLDGHKVEITADGSFIVEGAAQPVRSKSATPTLRLDDGKVTVE